MADKKVLITGASGYVASQILPTFKEMYETVLVDIKDTDRSGNKIEGINVRNLIDPDRSAYADLFDGVDAVIHLGHRGREGDPIDHFFAEKQNVEMAYNVFRSAYDAGTERVVMASSNHAADWYEHNLIHTRKMENLDPFKLPLSDNFYGWAKATYEHMGFLFACGFRGFRDDSGREQHTGGASSGRKMGVVMVRIGAPREIVLENYIGDPGNYKRDLGAYLSPRDLTQLCQKAVDAPSIDNEHGIPWQVVYGISNNTRAFWSLANARTILGYDPQDDAEVKYAADIQKFLMGEQSDHSGGRLGTH